MANFPWPGKIAAAGRVALEEARSAGLRFERAKFDLQERVISTYQDFALLGEEIRVRQADVALLELVTAAAEGRVRSGVAPQTDLLKARTELDLSRNELDRLRARVPGQTAVLNALLSRSSAERLVGSTTGRSTGSAIRRC